VCLLGMEEAAFPARDVRDGVSLLARGLGTRERRVGDPSRRDADRHLFLQLFASAGRVLYLSWCGMDPRDNSRREPSAVVAELLDAAAECHATADEATRAQLRETLVVRHALQPFSPAAFGAAHVGEAADARGHGDPRRFSYDARWREAADAVPGARAEPPFVAPGLLLAKEDPDERVVLLDRLRSTLLRPQAAYLREGLGLRLPEDEALRDTHEPLGSPDALRHYQLREAVFSAWLGERARPGAQRLQRRLLARAQLPPGADGAAAVAVLLDEVAPFAECALEAGFDSGSRRAGVDESLTTHRLRGALDGAHDGATGGQARLLRVALRAKGRHGNLVLRHGLDWLVASLLRLPVFELYKDAEDSAPTLRPRPLAGPDEARAALLSLVALHERARVEPLPFLPRSAHEWHAADTEARGWSAASGEWCGDGFNDIAGERSIATALALRGRDPFVDGDEANRARFAWLARAVFEAVEDATPFTLDDMPGSGMEGTR
jgi:exodeoxyribonuclease V gamma subunit